MSQEACNEHNYTAEQKLLHKRRARKSYDFPAKTSVFWQRVTMLLHKSIVARCEARSGQQWYYIQPLLPAARQDSNKPSF
jgi:hypothetical protein